MNLGCVIITKGNRPVWLAEAVESVRHVVDQLEVIDCGSVKPVEQATHRFKADMGIAYSMNFGVARLTTAWVMMLCDDDLVRTSALQQMKREYEERESQMNQVGQLMPDLMVVSVPVILFGDGPPGAFGEPVNRSELPIRNHIAYCSPFTYHLWEKVGGFDLDDYADWHFWVKASKAGAIFEWYPLAIVNHRQHQGQRSRHLSEASDLMLRELIRRV